MLKMRCMQTLLAYIRQSVLVAIVLAIASAADSVEHHRLLASLLWGRDHAMVVLVDFGQNLWHCLWPSQP
jgi:hypothetical protein